MNGIRLVKALYHTLHGMGRSVCEGVQDSIQYSNYVWYKELLKLQRSGYAGGSPHAIRSGSNRGYERKTYSQDVTLLMGAFNFKKHLFRISALISAPTPAVWHASCTMTSLPVRFTLSATVSASQGKIERKSMSSSLAERREAGMCASREGGGEESKCMAISQ